MFIKKSFVIRFFIKTTFHFETINRLLMHKGVYFVLLIIIDYVNDSYKINNYIYLIKNNSNYGVEHHYSPYISFLICYYLIILKIDRVERLNWDTKVNMV